MHMYQDLFVYIHLLICKYITPSIRARGYQIGPFLYVVPPPQPKIQEAVHYEYIHIYLKTVKIN
jgi:hypothetical protein